VLKRVLLQYEEEKQRAEKDELADDNYARNDSMNAQQAGHVIGPTEA
jgi:hypothetical protein